MDLNDIRALLRDVPHKWDRPTELTAQFLAEEKCRAVEANDQDGAKEIWCLEEALAAQTRFIGAFQRVQERAYYEGWCDFEQAELALLRLERHFPDKDDVYHTRTIAQLVKQWQQLYPYRIFMSPEFLIHEKRCNICNEVVNIRKPCGHRVGEVYDGRYCYRLVTKSEALGIAFVEKPVQRYSVPFVVDAKTGKSTDQYDYSLVEFAARRLASPFHGWSFERTTRRHPHARFSYVGRNDPCPCEVSKKKYKKCCLPIPAGVLRPHVQFTFAEALPDGVPHFEYAGYD